MNTGGLVYKIKSLIKKTIRKKNRLFLPNYIVIFDIIKSINAKKRWT